MIHIGPKVASPLKPMSCPAQTDAKQNSWEKMDQESAATVIQRAWRAYMSWWGPGVPEEEDDWEHWDGPAADYGVVMEVDQFYRDLGGW